MPEADRDQGRRLVPTPVRDVQPGMTIELVEGQRLWDFSTDPWTEYSAGARFTVAEVERLPTGRTDRQPYELTLTGITGSAVALEVDSGETLVHLVAP